MGQLHDSLTPPLIAFIEAQKMTTTPRSSVPKASGPDSSRRTCAASTACEASSSRRYDASFGNTRSVSSMNVSWLSGDAIR